MCARLGILYIYMYLTSYAGGNRHPTLPLKTALAPFPSAASRNIAGKRQVPTANYKNRAASPASYKSRAESRPSPRCVFSSSHLFPVTRHHCAACSELCSRTLHLRELLRLSLLERTLPRAAALKCDPVARTVLLTQCWS